MRFEAWQKFGLMKVIYVFDALCVWCYGFSPVITELYREYRRQLPFEVISGGMMRNDKSGSLDEVGAYIKDSYAAVEKKTGVQFGVGFLESLEGKSTSFFDSLVPARAISAFKSMNSETALLFAEAVQHAIFEDGIDPSNLLPYVDIADDFDIDAKEFKRRLQSEESKRGAEADFAKTIELGATGYPTVYFEFEGKHHLISRAYTDFHVLQARFDHVVNRAKRSEDA